MSKITEITFQVKRDTHTRAISGYKVWQRSGVPQEDPPRKVLYDGANFAEAYETMTRAVEFS